METSSASGARVLDGKAVAKSIREEVALGCASLRRSHGVVPGLTVVLVGDDPASQVYVRNKEKAAQEVGMDSRVMRLPAATSQDELLETVAQSNDCRRIALGFGDLREPSGFANSLYARRTFCAGILDHRPTRGIGFPNTDDRCRLESAFGFDGFRT
jgi:hypothetical protein